MDERVLAGRIPHEEDLMARVMIPDDRLGEDREWRGMMGPDEAELMHELHARWLLWRDEVILGRRLSPPAALTSPTPCISAHSAPNTARGTSATGC